MVSLLLVVDLRLEVHHKLELIFTMLIANFTYTIITLRLHFHTLWLPMVYTKVLSPVHHDGDVKVGDKRLRVKWSGSYYHC